MFDEAVGSKCCWRIYWSWSIYTCWFIICIYDRSRLWWESRNYKENNSLEHFMDMG
jgi:hypothetical protein